jgi:hypothetical protein
VRWSKGAQTKRLIQWTKFTIGFNDDEVINDHKVIDEGHLVGCSNNKPTVVGMQGRVDNS